MIPFPNISPDAVVIGPIHIRWYGLMYVLGFLAAYFLIQRQDRSRQMGLVGNTAQDLIFYIAVGLIVGARLGYVVFYDYSQYMTYLENPLEIIATWHGGMSFHGGLLGSTLGCWWFCRRRQLPFLAVVDSVTVTAPIGLGLGRLGNFINGELLGLPTNVPWAMVFPDGGPQPRHPSQLYEAVMEGPVLFLLLWWLRKHQFRDGMMLVFFMFFYGVIRFFIEFFKEPDPQIGYLFQYFTMGQLLCIAMIFASGLLAVFLRNDQPSTGAGKIPT
jgi:phosphatidylglycerol---prolipoprotein diacylglyceryl transferase